MVGAVTSRQLDNINVSTLRSGSGVAHSIAQLLVDIRAQDANDLQNWVEANAGQPVPRDFPSKRWERFKDAFHYIFPRKRLAATELANNSIEIVFNECGRDCTLNQLSTGEKQIVFRGGFVLNYLKQLQSGLLLIDEPELGLHPDWQSRILGFYQRLMPQSELSKSQIIVATHSPFVVHNAPNAKVIILEKNSITGEVQCAAVPAFPSAGRTLAIQAFNVDSFLRTAQHELLVLVEGETDRLIIETAWKKLYPGSVMFFELRAALGAKNINITLNDSTVFTKIGDRKIVGIFDFDNAYSHWNGVWKNSFIMTNKSADSGLVKKHRNQNGWAILLPVPNFRSGYASEELKGNSILSIEFMFPEENISNEFIKKTPAPLGALLPVFNDNAKMAFAESVVKFEAISFSSFIPLFERLKDIRRQQI